MINQNAVDELIDFKEQIAERIKESPIILTPRNVNQISLNQKGKETYVEINGKFLKPKAVKKLADQFRIKSKFFQLGKELGKEELADITDKLKNLKSQTILCDEGPTHIRSIYFEYPETKRKYTGHLEVIDNLNRIIKSVGESSVPLTVSRKTFSDRQHANIELITNDTIEVLKDDPWKVGIQTDFSKTEFNISPFLLRKICINGMIAAQYGFQSNISQMKWNTEKIEDEIYKIFTSPTDEMKHKIIENVNILKNTNISVSELNKTRNLFLNTIEDESSALSIIGRYFSTENLEKYYGDLETKTPQYLRTADTGVNAYDHFNKLTWITSHLNESGLSPDDQFRINLRAGDILFTAEELDMNQIAPKINFN